LYVKITVYSNNNSIYTSIDLKFLQMIEIYIHLNTVVSDFSSK